MIRYFQFLEARAQTSSLQDALDQVTQVFVKLRSSVVAQPQARPQAAPTATPANLPGKFIDKVYNAKVKNQGASYKDLIRQVADQELRKVGWSYDKAMQYMHANTTGSFTLPPELKGYPDWVWDDHLLPEPLRESAGAYTLDQAEDEIKRLIAGLMKNQGKELTNAAEQGTKRALSANRDAAKDVSEVIHNIIQLAEPMKLKGIDIFAFPNGREGRKLRLDIGSDGEKASNYEHIFEKCKIVQLVQGRKIIVKYLDLEAGESVSEIASKIVNGEIG